jgi:hypothetical protein
MNFRLTAIGIVLSYYQKEAWLLYWLFKQRVQGREAMVMYGALGSTSIRLIVDTLSFFRK